MPRYLILTQYTAEGRRAVRKDGYASRLEVGARAATAMGGSIEALYYVRPGIWDQVVIGELAEDSTFRLAAATMSSGAYSNVEFLRLYQGEEADSLLAQDIGWSAPGTS